MAPGVDIFSQLSPILRSAGTSVYSSGQVFVQAGSGVDFFCLEFFKGQFGVSLSVRERERELGTGIFILEGNRAPVAKATHARNWVSPISEDGRDPFRRA